MRTFLRYTTLTLALAACSTAPKPRELEAFETIKAQQGTYQLALKRAPALVAEAEKLLERSRAEWESKNLEESRVDALMGQTKLKTAYALVEQDQAKARMDAASARLAKTEEEHGRTAKELQQVTEQVALLKKLGDQKSLAAADKERMMKQLADEQRRNSEEKDRSATQQKIAAAELALKSAESVNAATYAAVELGAAKDMLERARTEAKSASFGASAVSADQAKAKAEQAYATAKPQFDSAEAGKDQKAKNEELSREAAALPGTTVRLERKGEVQRLVLPYGKLFTGKNTTITPGNDAQLDGVAALLKKHPSYTVQVVGHTDSRGKKDALLALSMARAQAVYNALINRGLDARRMMPSGMGGDQPAADNKSTAGRAANNRIEIVLILQ